MTDLRKLEYRVREKTVYFVTRYCEVGGEETIGHSSTVEGNFEDILTAQRAALALTKADHCREGLPNDDPRIVWPEPLKYGSLPQG